MPSAATIRNQIENALAKKIPAALSPSPRVVTAKLLTGIHEIDVLCGGLPVGAITEMSGHASGGRTTVALSLVAGETQSGACCAYVDTNDVLDIESAFANGVDGNRLLWVRCPSRPKPQMRVEAALRAADLILQTAGFKVVVLDLAGSSPAHTSRIPLTTWFRFRQMAQEASCCLLVLTTTACAHSSAELSLRFAPMQVQSLRGNVVRGAKFEVERMGQRFANVHAFNSIPKKPSASCELLAAWTPTGTSE